METLRDYVKIAEAADYLGISQSTLRKWADEGKIAASINPANGYRLFRRDDLEQFLNQVRQSARQRKKPR